MRMLEKCHNNSDNPLASRRTDGGKNTGRVENLAKHNFFFH